MGGNLIVFIFFSPMKTQQCKLSSYFEQFLYELANLKYILSQVLKYTLINEKKYWIKLEKCIECKKEIDAITKRSPIIWKWKTPPRL